MTAVFARVHPEAPAVPDRSEALYRSGAVARMVGMPVGTLRTWERRFQVTASKSSGSGHRHYTAADIRRLALLKRLTDLGHAIGAVAPLNMAKLRQLCEVHARAVAARQMGTPIPGGGLGPRQIAVVGASLALRLQRPAFARQHGSQLLCIGASESLGAALRLHKAGKVSGVVVQAEVLHPSLTEALCTAAAVLPTGALALLHVTAPTALLGHLKAAGVSVRREPITDARLAAWLRKARAAEKAQSWSDPDLPPGLPAPPRFDSNALADLAALSTSVDCECPRHLAVILMGLLKFERYSAQCAERDPEDADMHGYLQRVAGAARRHFEAAIERLARHEGLLLPD